MISSALLNIPANVSIPSFLDILKQLNISELNNLPLVGKEEFERPWHVIDLESFINYYDLGFYFENNNIKPSFYNKLYSLDKFIITSDLELACQRFVNGMHLKTGVRSSIGSIAQIIDAVLYRKTISFPSKVLAIVDSCCSDIIIEMETKHLSVNKAIEELQWKGLIASNISKHIHGIVAKNKFFLLSSILFGKILNFDKIQYNGITSLTLTDIKIASEIRFKIRFLGFAEIQQSNLYVFVKPIMLPSRYLMAQNKMNTECVYVVFDNNHSIFYASSANKFDFEFLEAIKDWTIIKAYNKLTYYDFFNDNLQNVCYDYSRFIANFYLRFTLTDVEYISNLFNYLKSKKIDVLKFYQFDSSLTSEKGEKTSANECDLVIITKKIEYGKIDEVCKTINFEIPLITLKSYYQIEGL